MVSLSIILPAYNEESAIRQVIEDIVKNVNENYEIVVVDDGSKDNTAGIVKTINDRRVRLVRHASNKGKPEAIRTGVKYAKGSIIVLMDADYTYPAKHIEEAVRKVNSGSDMVLGNRFAFSANISPINKIGNVFFSMLISYYTFNSIRDAQTGFRAFKKELFDKIDIRAKGLEYETKQTIRALYGGYTISEIPIEYRKRLGKSKLNRIPDGYRMFRAIFSVVYQNMSMSTLFLVILSAFLFLIALGFGSISLKEKIVYGVLTHAYYPIISVMAGILAFQTFSLGIILDSLGRQLNRIERILNKHGFKRVN